MWSPFVGFSNWKDTPKSLLPTIKQLISSGIRVWLYRQVPTFSKKKNKTHYECRRESQWIRWANLIIKAVKVGGLIIRLAMRPIQARTILGWISQPYQPAYLTSLHACPYIFSIIFLPNRSFYWLRMWVILIQRWHRWAVSSYIIQILYKQAGTSNKVIMAPMVQPWGGKNTNIHISWLVVTPPNKGPFDWNNLQSACGDENDGDLLLQVGGYVVGYKGLAFVTVRGAGHMVPSYKPQRALTMISSFLKGALPPSS